MSVTFRLIGLWHGETAPHDPNVERFIDLTGDTSDREAVATRLDQAVRTDRAFMGRSKCRLCGCSNGSGERTDGVYIWPEGLAHYVRDHGVRLPADIEAHLLGADPPEADQVRKAVEASNEERDTSWWRQITSKE